MNIAQPGVYYDLQPTATLRTEGAGHSFSGKGVAPLIRCRTGLMVTGTSGEIASLTHILMHDAPMIRYML